MEKKRLFHELWTTVLEIVKSWNHKCHWLPYSSSPPSPFFRSSSPAIILENGCSKISQNPRGGFCFYFLQHVVPRILRQIFLGISSIDYLFYLLSFSKFILFKLCYYFMLIFCYSCNYSNLVRTEEMLFWRLRTPLDEKKN